ncbi:MAG: hypothetical protein WAN46_21320 [Gammaproteobacteria bacterium]
MPLNDAIQQGFNLPVDFVQAAVEFGAAGVAGGAFALCHSV